MYNFDAVIDRSGTNALKHMRGPKECRYGEELYMSVADMEFETAPAVKEALLKRVAHGIYGYTLNPQNYNEVVLAWAKTRHGVDADAECLTTTPGVVAALRNSVCAFTQPGDGVLIQEPVYHPFRAAVESNGRKFVNNKLVYENGGYHIDFADFEQKIMENNVKLFLLCNPHNPTGNVWTRDELYRMGTICREHNVIIVDDEIHNDFVFKGVTHTPILAVDPSFGGFTLLCTAPSKTFNLAGIKVSNIFIPNPDLRQRFNEVKAAHGLSANSALAGLAVVAAYSEGAEWVDELVEYIHGNLCWFESYLKEKLPQLHMVNHDALYLAWVDCRAWGMSDDELKDFFLKKCGIVPNMGTEFGEGGSGFARFNLACPRSVVEEALTRIEKTAREKGLL